MRCLIRDCTESFLLKLKDALWFEDKAKNTETLLYNLQLPCAIGKCIVIILLKRLVHNLLNFF